MLYACSVLAKTGSDAGHGINLLSVAAPGEVVDGRVQTLENGAVSVETAHTLADFIADVARVDIGEDEGVGIDTAEGSGNGNG